ncbi:HAD family phosphatase [Flavobacteriaceae bacterium]|nr:HAD family phosphatase [Flavobacteriaceae bacterium]MDB3863183.1 HAD family phosphatase [Flavobacteriaceae bacterium]
MNTIKNIIFDLGGVLVDWNPEYVYLDVFDGDQKKMQWFFDEVCTFDWNENQDAGYPIAQATADRIKLFPQYEEWIRMFYGRWEEMLGGPIEGTVALLKKLVENPDYKVVALTNWSAETFPVALKRFEFLHWFEGIVVSGTEKTRKPFLDIYQITLDRYQLNPTDSLFIDDNKRNIEAAEELGIQTIHFQNPIQLQTTLEKMGIEL